jgi:hypothetical protein
MSSKGSELFFSFGRIGSFGNFISFIILYFKYYIYIYIYIYIYNLFIFDRCKTNKFSLFFLGGSRATWQTCH